MFPLSLSWRQGCVGSTCTYSGSVGLSVLDEFSCAWSYLHVIRACFVYNTYWSRFRCICYFICISGKKLMPSSRCIPSIHQGPLLPISFLPGLMSMSSLCGCSLLWGFVSHLSVDPMMSLELTLLHSVWWPVHLSLYLKMAYFHISILSMIHNSFETSVTFLYPFLCPGTLCLVSSLWCSEWCLGPSWGVWCSKSVHFWNILGEGLVCHTLSASLLLCFSLMSVHISSHAYSGFYHIYPKSRLKHPLY